jgi:hypothetical protein
MEKKPTFGVNCKSSCVDGLISNNDIAIFVDKDEVRDTDLREVL